MSELVLVLIILGVACAVWQLILVAQHVAVLRRGSGSHTSLLPMWLSVALFIAAVLL